MDPVTLIVSALAAGAAAGVKDTAKAVVKDAYGSLKAVLSRRYHHVDVEALERKPGSDVKRASVAEDLTDAGAGEDAELIELARQLVAVVRENDAEAGPAVGVDLEDVEAEFIRISKITSTGTGFAGRKLKVAGGIDVGEVDAGRRSGPENP